MDHQHIILPWGAYLSNTTDKLLNVAGQVEMGEHHSLGQAGSAAGVRQGYYILHRVDIDRGQFPRAETCKSLEGVTAPRCLFTDDDQMPKFGSMGKHGIKYRV